MTKKNVFSRWTWVQIPIFPFQPNLEKSFGEENSWFLHDQRSIFSKWSWVQIPFFFHPCKIWKEVLALVVCFHLLNLITSQLILDQKMFFQSGPEFKSLFFHSSQIWKKVSVKKIVGSFMTKDQFFQSGPEFKSHFFFILAKFEKRF